MKTFASGLRILIIEDDARMLDLLCQGLREAGQTVMPASDGNAGVELATSVLFDLIVLDIGLPCRDGFEVTRILRDMDHPAGILMLTARDTEDDIIRGLDLGADDYLTKPFSFPELLARLQALARTRRPSGSPRIMLDPIRMTATRDSKPIALTRTEFLLLASLTDRAGETVTRQCLVDAAWGKAHPVHSNNLEVFINSLRMKIDAPFKSNLIRTVRGVGYRFHVESNASHFAGGESA